MAVERKFRETIVFTPHFGGGAGSVRRHQEFFEQLGYATEFVPYEFGKEKQALSAIFHMKFGLRSLWLKQLTDVLDRIEGPKILFSFSFPSCTILQLMAETPRDDVKGWITDGGPFLWPWLGIGNFFRHTRPDLGKWGILTVRAVGFVILGGPMYMRHLQRWVRKVPPTFPILSVRAGRDALVPEGSIDAVFALNAKLNLKILRLPEAEHMLGLKSYPEKFKPAVVQFLTPLTTG